MPDNTCPFCTIPPEDIICENTLAVAIYDRYPVCDGHVLVMPRRHVASFFDAYGDEITAIHDLLLICRGILEEKYRPDGFNIGVNVGAAAGQTVFHLHVHLIPRYPGDHPAPRGGIRHVIPGMGNYTTD